MSLPPNHFLNLARTTFPGPTPDAFDISTVAAADYDVDVRSGFMPPNAPPARLPEAFALWEDILDLALGKLKLAATATPIELDVSEKWRQRVREMPILPSTSLHRNEVLLRRAHVVLTYMMHLYVHSAPHPNPSTPISIPAPISLPLLTVSQQLGTLPILTYADTVLWNFTSSHPANWPTPSTIHTRTSFTGTPAEEHFYLTSAFIELRGVEALSLMRSTLDETFLGDAIAVKRVAEYLGALGGVIDDIAELLMGVRDGCDPAVFYNEIRPWFNGGNSHPAGWMFEGVPTDEAPEVWEKYSKLGGPSAGQSSLVHALDVFLGVDHARPQFPPASAQLQSPEGNTTSSSTTSRQSSPSSDSTFLERQKQYMPRHHRLFLNNLASTEQPVRAFVERQPIRPSPLSMASPTAQLKEAYNSAVMALKRFRDGHVRIATIYIITQARAATILSAASANKGHCPEDAASGAKGTGGTLLIPFLKGARDNTFHTVLKP